MERAGDLKTFHLSSLDIVARAHFGPVSLELCSLLFFLEPFFFGTPGFSGGPARLWPAQGFPQEAHKTVQSCSPVTGLAARLLTADAQHSGLIDSCPQQLPQSLFLNFVQARRRSHVEKQGNPGADLVDVLPTGSAASGTREGDFGGWNSKFTLDLNETVIILVSHGLGQSMKSALQISFQTTPGIGCRSPGKIGVENELLS